MPLTSNHKQTVGIGDLSDRPASIGDAADYPLREAHQHSHNIEYALVIDAQSLACILAEEELQEYALVIDAQSLAFILAEEELQERFLQACINCASVLCCRVSPRQKTQVTRLVRKGLGQKRLCLAIGDGANDVGMIQATDVGVGIASVEGAQILTIFQAIQMLILMEKREL